MAGYGDKPFGLHEIRLVSADGNDVVDLEVSRVMSFTPRMLTGELTGSDKLASVASFIEALEWSLEEGGIPLEALGLITGHTVTESGSTPNRTNTLKLHAASKMPYFKIYGKALGEGDDDVHVKIWKAKLTGNIEGQFQYGEFYVTSMNGLAVEDAVNGLTDVVQNETTANLPAN
jgi:hypothetical protein